LIPELILDECFGAISNTQPHSGLDQCGPIFWFLNKPISNF